MAGQITVKKLKASVPRQIIPGDVSKRATSLFERLLSYIRLVAWTLRVAQKPSPREFKLAAKMILILTFGVGLYAFLMSLVRLLAFAGRPGGMPLAKIPPTAGIVIAGVIAAIVIGIVVYMYFSIRKTVKEEARRRV